jgi:hypothetical protein
MNALKALPVKYPIFYFLGWILVILVNIWIFWQTVKFSWIAGAMLIGLQVILLTAWRKKVRPSLWSILTNLAASFGSVWFFFVFQQAWWVKCLASVIVITPLFMLANQANKLDIRRDMRRRSEIANEIKELALTAPADEVPPFALYLRPFLSTGRLVAQVLPSDLKPMDRPVHLDFETVLERAFMGELDLIALGKPEDILEGISRLNIPDEGWQEVVRALADRASFIFFVPLLREGTMWELRELKTRNLLGKTVFIMPQMQIQQPNNVWVATEQEDAWEASGVWSYDAAEHYIDFQEEWMKVREHILQSEGMELPRYCRWGGLFTIHPETGKPQQIAPLNIAFLNQRGKYIKTVVTEFGLIPGKERTGCDLLEAYESSTFPNANNREFVLFGAFELFVTAGDASTASRILQRMQRINPDHVLPVNEGLAMLPDSYTEPGTHEFYRNHYEDIVNYMNTLRAIEGVDQSLVDEAMKVLDGVVKDE